MFRLVALLILVAGAIGSPITRIVNGTDAKEGEIPYIISLRYYGSHNCGGSILDERHILTAGHCVGGVSASDLQVQYGVLEITSNENVIDVTKYVIHPKYSPPNNYANDVAVLTLADSIKFSDVARPIVLPLQGAETPGNQDAVLAGWGTPYTGGDIMEHLQRVDIICYTDDDCEAAHGGSAQREYHVCAGVPEGGKGQCSGDSGGPLTVDGVQYGVVSWSVKPCTVKGYPGVFARVAQYVDWIWEQTQD